MAQWAEKETQEEPVLMEVGNLVIKTWLFELSGLD